MLDNVYYFFKSIIMNVTTQKVNTRISTGTRTSTTGAGKGVKEYVAISGAIGYHYYKFGDKFLWILEDNHGNDKYCNKSKKFEQQASLVSLFRICSDKDVWRIFTEEPDDKYKKRVELVPDFAVPHTLVMSNFKQSNIEKKDIRHNPEYDFYSLTEDKLRDVIRHHNMDFLKRLQDKIVKAFQYTQKRSGHDDKFFNGNSKESLYNWVINHSLILEKCTAKNQCIQIFMDWLLEAYLISSSFECKKNVMIYIGAWHSRSINMLLKEIKELVLTEAYYKPLLEPTEESCILVDTDSLTEIFLDKNRLR